MKKNLSTEKTIVYAKRKLSENIADLEVYEKQIDNEQRWLATDSHQLGTHCVNLSIEKIKDLQSRCKTVRNAISRLKKQIVELETQKSKV